MSYIRCNAKKLLATTKYNSVGDNWNSAHPVVESKSHEPPPFYSDHGQQTSWDEAITSTARSGSLTESSADVKMKAQSSLKAAFTISEASVYSGLSRSFLYDLFDQGLVPRLKAGKRVLIMKSDLDEYLQSLREVAIK